MNCKDRTTLCYLIDGALFVSLMSLTGIGLLLAFVLVPGRQAHEVYGPGVHLTWLGWDRHQWGDLHLVLSLVFVGLCVLHVALHWRQIICWLQRRIPKRGARTLVGAGVAVVGLAAVSLALVAQPEVQHHGRGHGWRHGDAGQQRLKSRRLGCRRAPDQPTCRRASGWRAR